MQPGYLPLFQVKGRPRAFLWLQKHALHVAISCTCPVELLQCSWMGLRIFWLWSQRKLCTWQCCSSGNVASFCWDAHVQQPVSAPSLLWMTLHQPFTAWCFFSSFNQIFTTTMLGPQPLCLYLPLQKGWPPILLPSSCPVHLPHLLSCRYPHTNNLRFHLIPSLQTPYSLLTRAPVRRPRT